MDYLKWDLFVTEAVATGGCDILMEMIEEEWPVARREGGECWSSHWTEMEEGVVCV